VKDLRIDDHDIPRSPGLSRQRLDDLPDAGLMASGIDGDGPIRLAVPADPRFIGLARLCIAGVAATADARLDEIDDLRMAVTEACQWLLEGMRGGSLEFSIRKTPEGVEGSVAAYSSGTPTAVHEPSSLSRAILSSTVDTFEMVVDHAVPRCLFSKRLQTAT
jgi:hypothetical protein